MSATSASGSRRPASAVITSSGYRRLPDGEVAEIADRVIAGRMQRPDGPTAALT